jgi:adenine-specific DNA-methyltransferase
VPKELDTLKRLLAEIFQLDEAEDLDFGMYRVLRLRRQELMDFLDRTLAETVTEAMGTVAGDEKAKILTRMHELEAQAVKFKGTPDGDPEYQALKARLDAAGDASTQERQVYAHLAEFFSRYYDEGDFLSLPRLRGSGSADAYAIPYDGSEVVLHWANKDQYYVKSGEYFARYAFPLADDRRVVFRLVGADTDPDNVKTADAAKRRFRLQSS